MNIVYLHRTQGKGAEGVHVREIVRAWRHMGHEVTVVSPPGVDPMTSAVQKSLKVGGRPHVLQGLARHLPQICFELLEIGYNFYMVPTIRKALSSPASVDLLYERYAFFGWVGSWLACRRGIPVVLEVNEISGIKRLRGQVMVMICRRIELGIFRRAHHIIVVSDFLRDQLIDRGVNLEKIHVLPNAVNLDLFNPFLDPEPVRNRFGLQGKIVLCFVGMFSHWDQLDRLLDAYSEIHQQAPATHLVIVGDGVLRASLEAHADALGLSSAVSFTGCVDREDVTRILAAADICVLYGSNDFGSPIALFEYMAMGKAVVVPSYSPISAVVTHGETGYLFPPGSRDIFVHSVLRLVSDRSLRQRIGCAARERIVAKHQWKNNARTIVEIIDA